MAAVAQGEPATALILVMQWMLARALSRPDCRWPQPVRDAVLRSAITDGAPANQLRVEPELGSPARGGLPATVARRTPDGWRISGHKRYTTGIDGLRWLVVWGRTDEPVPRVGQFLVRADAPGLQIQRSWDHLGMRATVSDEVVLTDVPIRCSATTATCCAAGCTRRRTTAPWWLPAGWPCNAELHRRGRHRATA